MSKNKILLSSSLSAFTSLFGTANADVIRTSESSGDVEIIKVNGSVNEKDLLSIQNLINNLVKNYKGIKFSTSEITLTNDNVNEIKNSLVNVQKYLNELEKQENEYNVQKQTSAKFGVEDLINKKKITIDLSKTLDLEDELKELVQDRKDFIKNNQSVLLDLGSTDSSATFEKSKQEEFNKAKDIIKKSLSDKGHYADGILGNLDDIHRKVEDSVKEGKKGVKVDTSVTKQVNVIENTTENFIPNTNEDVNTMVRNVLSKIAEVDKENEKQVLNSQNYKQNALTNIDAINKWLEKEQKRADNIQSEIEKNITSLTMMNDYKESQKIQLEKAKELINASNKSEKTKAKMLESIEDALNKLNTSGVQMNVTETINAADNVDFGDIGRNSSDITNKMNEASTKIDSVVNTALDKLKQSNANAINQIQGTISKNKEAITNFVNKVAKGGGGSQIDESFLNTLPIYQNSSAYQSYIKQALAQTEENLSDVFMGEQLLEPSYKDMVLKFAKPGKSVASIAAAEFASKSANGFEGGYGSVMLPSDNVNDFMTVQGTKFANSQSFKGGAQGILDAIGSHATMTNGSRGWSVLSKFSVFQDIKNQHISYVGNNKVLLVASYNPTLTVNMSKAFVGFDENGNVKQSDMTLTLNAYDFAGKRITNGSVGGVGYTNLYLYYFSVDPATGKLLTGVGYYTHATNLKSGGGGIGGGGELRLGLDNNSNSDTKTLASLTSNAALSPIQTRGGVRVPTQDSGFYVTFDTRVDSSAGAYAEDSPLFIGDIDDHQSLYVYKDTNYKITDIILSSNEAPQIRDGGDYYALDSNIPKRDGINGSANLDENSVMITGRSTVGIGHAGGGDGYYSIDVSLFNPWGTIGAPTLKLDQINSSINTFTLSEPSAIAHTEGKYHIKKINGDIIQSKPASNKEPLYYQPYEIILPKIVDTYESEKKVTSNTSLVVKQIIDEVKKSSSSNSLVTRNVDSKKSSSGNTLIVKEEKGKNSSSGNTLVVRNVATNMKSASGNTLVINTITPVVKTSGSGNSLITNTINNELKLNSETLKLKVHIDSTLEKEGRKALEDWKIALAKHNINIQLEYTNIKNGVDIAILDGDSKTTRVDYGYMSVNTDDDYGFELTELAGLMSKTSTVNLVDADSNDKYNRQGIRSKDVLAKAKYIVQLNTDAIKNSENKEKVLKHEIGHVFGLQHDNNDSLMTTFYNDPIFNGEISIKDASLAVEHIKKGEFCTCTNCVNSRL